MIARREALGLLAGLAAVAACGGAAPRGTGAPGAPPVPLALDPVVDLVPAAGLTWLVDARLRDLLGSPVLIPAVALLVPEARFLAFAQRNGGVDPRQVSELAVAGYPDATLALARTIIDPARVESAFAARALAVEGRAVDGAVTRVWGTVGDAREQVAAFDRQAIGIERGRLGPLRAAIYFAERKLKRSQPALRAEPLARAAELLGTAPLRAFAPGPFEGEWAEGLGGLLRATTAVGAALRPRDAGPAGALDVSVVLTGAWGAEAPAAAQRLEAAFRVLADDPLGRLTGIDHPLEAPRVSADPEALRLAVSLDPMPLARGLHELTDATMAEIMGS